MSWMARSAAAAALTAALVATGAGSAAAVPRPSVPDDVAAAFAGGALEQALAGAENDPALASFVGAGAEDVHEIFSFSQDVVAGVETAEPVLSTGSWVGALARGGRVVGVLWVRKPDGGPATMQGYADDVALGTALAGVAPTDVLIEDAPAGSWYAWDGRTVRPLNDWARDTLPEPVAMGEAQRVVAAQARLREEQAAPVDGHPPALTVSLVAMTLALLVGASLAVHARRRRRLRRGTGSE